MRRSRDNSISVRDIVGVAIAVLFLYFSYMYFLSNHHVRYLLLSLFVKLSGLTDDMINALFPVAMSIR